MGYYEVKYKVGNQTKTTSGRNLSSVKQRVKDRGGSLVASKYVSTSRSATAPERAGITTATSSSTRKDMDKTVKYHKKTSSSKTKSSSNFSSSGSKPKEDTKKTVESNSKYDSPIAQKIYDKTGGKFKTLTGMIEAAYDKKTTEDIVSKSLADASSPDKTPTLYEGQRVKIISDTTAYFRDIEDVEQFIEKNPDVDIDKIVTSGRNEQVIWHKPSESEIQSAYRKAYQQTGYVPYDISSQIQTPGIVKEMGLGSLYKKEGYEDYLGLNKKSRPEGFVGPIDTRNEFEKTFKKKYSDLPDVKKFEYGLRYGDIKEKPIGEQLKYEGASEYYKNLPEDKFKQKLQTYIESPSFKKYLKTTTGKTQLDVMKKSLYDKELTKPDTYKFSIPFVGVWDTGIQDPFHEYTMSAVAVYKPEEAKKELAKLKLTTSPENFSDKFWKGLDKRTQVERTLYESAVRMATYPVTLPQRVVKHFNKGDTIILPDVAEGLAKRKISRAQGAIGGTTGEIISGVTEGKSSGFFDYAARNPFMTGVATAGEIIGLKVASAGAKVVKTPIARGFKSFKIKYPTFGKYANIASKYRPDTFIKKGFSDLGKSTIEYLPKIGRKLQSYSGIKSGSLNRLYSGLKSSTLGKNLNKWTKGYVRGKELFLKNRNIFRDKLTKNRVTYDIYKRLESYKRIGKRTWMSPDEVAKYKPGTRLDYMVKYTKRGPYLDTRHLLEKTVISKPSGKIFTNISKQLDDIAASKTYTFGRYIPSKYQLKPPSSAGTLISNLKTGKTIFKPKKIVSRKGLGSYFKSSVKPKIEIGFQRIYNFTGKKMDAILKGKPTKIAEYKIEWGTKIKKIYPWAKDKIRTKPKLAGSESKQLLSKIDKLKKGYSFTIQEGKTFYGPLQIKHIGKGGKTVIGDTSFIMKNLKTTKLVKGGKFPSPETLPQLYGGKWGSKSSALSKIKTGMQKLKQNKKAMQKLTPEIKLRIEKTYKPLGKRLFKITKKISKPSIKIPLSNIQSNIPLTSLALGSISSSMQKQKPIQTQKIGMIPEFDIKTTNITANDMKPKIDSIKIVEPISSQKTSVKPVQSLKQPLMQKLKLKTFKTPTTTTVKTPVPSPIGYKTPFRIKVPFMLSSEKIRYKKPKKKTMIDMDELFKFRKAKIHSPFENLGGLK